MVPGERDALLSRLADLLSSSTPQIGVHFEMASFVEESLMEDLLQYVIPHVCINEQYHLSTASAKILIGYETVLKDIKVPPRTTE